MLPTRMLVIQPTPFCNIDCDYCYLGRRNERGVMSGVILERIAREIVANIDPDLEPLIVWHGGEPTAVPLDWYRSAYPILTESKRGKPLAFTLQTNGIALNDAWAAFLARTQTSVGLSIDGPEALHDRHRRTRAGRPTWQRTTRALPLLRAHGIEPGLITVLTADSLDQPEAMLDFYVEHGIQKLSFSVEEQEGANASSSLDFRDVETAMEDFLFRFMQGLTAHGAEISLRDAERILGLLASGRSNAGLNEQTEPLACITVDWTGGVYTFSPEFTEHATGALAHARIGHLGRQTLAEIVAGPELALLSAQVAEGLAECQRTCQFWDICAGGSPVNRWAEHGTLSVAETQFCRLTVQATARALRRLLAT